MYQSDDDYYQFVETLSHWENIQKMYKIGDRVTVQVSKKHSRPIDYELVENGEEVN